MALKTYNPVTPSQRQLVTVDRSSLYRGKPVKALTEGLHSHGGRNATGRITVRFRGGGHKQAYRVIDFKRQRFDDRVMNVRAATHTQCADVVAGLLRGLYVLDHRLCGEHFDHFVIDDEVETLAIVQTFDHLQRRRLHLIQLQSRHPAASINDNRDLTLDRRCIGFRLRRSDHHKKIATADLRIRISEQ